MKSRLCGGPATGLPVCKACKAADVSWRRYRSVLRAAVERERALKRAEQCASQADRMALELALNFLGGRRRFKVDSLK